MGRLPVTRKAPDQIRPVKRFVQCYPNLDGDSGVLAFQTGRDSILVQFRTGSYLYTYASTGKREVEQMKQLAAEGRGLATFISQHVGKRYQAKLA